MRNPSPPRKGAPLRRSPAAWFDRDSDGRCEAGEATSLRALGVRSVATRGRDGGDGVLGNPAGIVLESGRQVPTYDWITEPADGSAALPLLLPHVRTSGE